MIYYRLPLLIIISLCCLGWIPNRQANRLNVKQLTSNRKVEIIAQNTSPDSSPSSSNSEQPTYDRYMQAGYQATKEQNYQKAKEQFTKALQERPNDIYAEQALQNVEVYLAKQANPLSNLGSSGIWLLSGLVVILLGTGITLWLFLRRSSPYEKDKFEEDLLTPQKDDTYLKETQTATENLSHKEATLTNSSDKETVLPLQRTTRLPNRDPIETLMDDLHESDPKKRRKAIWELAQKADSRAMKPLVDLMIDTDSQERSLILEALSQISVRTLKPMNQALAISLQDKNPQVRKNAIRDLTRIYELMSQISQMLCHAIDDSDKEVQETAKWAINQLNTQVPPRLDFSSGDADSEVTVEQSYSDSTEEI